jgi:hypothetical protein
MIYFKWLGLAFIALVAKYFIAWPLTFFIVPLATSENKLPWWLSWFDTDDNTLDGDPGWRNENMPYRPENNRYQRYVNRCFWLWRNSIYGFSRQVMGVQYQDLLCETLDTVGDPAVSNGPPGVSGTVKRYLIRDGKLIAFQWYYIRQYKRWPGICIRINIGWKLWNYDGTGTPRAMHTGSLSPWAEFTP